MCGSFISDILRGVPGKQNHPGKECTPREQSDIRQPIARSLGSGAHSRDPVAHPGYGCWRGVAPGAGWDK